MFRRSLVVLTLLTVPAIASSQSGKFGGGKGGADANWDAIKGGSAGVDLSAKDVENISPIKLIVDKRKDLKLSDEQLNKVKAIDEALKGKNEPLFKALDSLRKASKAPPMNPNSSKEVQQAQQEEDRARLTAAKREMSGTVKDIRDNYELSLKEVLALLDEAQQKTANEMVDKQRQDAQKMLSEKLGGGRR